MLEEIEYYITYPDRDPDPGVVAESVYMCAKFAKRRYRRTALYYDTWNVINQDLQKRWSRPTASVAERYAFDDNLLIAARYRQAFHTVRNTYTDKRGMTALKQEYDNMVLDIKARLVVFGFPD